MERNKTPRQNLDDKIQSNQRQKRSSFIRTIQKRIQNKMGNKRNTIRQKNRQRTIPNITNSKKKKNKKWIQNIKKMVINQIIWTILGTTFGIWYTINEIKEGNIKINTNPNPS